MKYIDSFLITYATLAFSSVIALSLIGLETLDVYVALFAIEFLVASELTPGFGSIKSGRKMIFEAVLLAVFALIVIERVIALLSIT